MKSSDVISSLPLPKDLTLKIYGQFQDEAEGIRKRIPSADKEIEESYLFFSQVVKHYLRLESVCDALLEEFQHEIRCLILVELYKYIFHMFLHYEHIFKPRYGIWNSIYSKTLSFIDQIEKDYQEGHLKKELYLETMTNLKKVQDLMEPIVDPWFPF